MSHFALDPVGSRQLRGQGQAAQVKATPASDGIVRVPVVIGIEKFLEPLNELKVILEAAFNQAVDRNNLKQTRVAFLCERLPKINVKVRPDCD